LFLLRHQRLRSCKSTTVKFLLEFFIFLGDLEHSFGMMWGLTLRWGSTLKRELMLELRFSSERQSQGSFTIELIRLIYASLCKILASI
jgi:hypothetical protein